jgi:hypothetical protein
VDKEINKIEAQVYGKDKETEEESVDKNVEV